MHTEIAEKPQTWPKWKPQMRPKWKFNKVEERSIIRVPWMITDFLGIFFFLAGKWVVLVWFPASVLLSLKKQKKNIVIHGYHLVTQTLTINTQTLTINTQTLTVNTQTLTVNQTSKWLSCLQCHQQSITSRFHTNDFSAFFLLFLRKDRK